MLYRDHREVVTDDMMKSFQVKNKPAQKGPGRRTQRPVCLSPGRYQIGDRDTLMSPEHWEEVKSVARQEGASFGMDSVSPRMSVMLGKALEKAMQRRGQSFSRELRKNIEAVWNICEMGRGIRVASTVER